MGERAQRGHPGLLHGVPGPQPHLHVAGRCTPFCASVPLMGFPALVCQPYSVALSHLCVPLALGVPAILRPLCPLVGFPSPCVQAILCCMCSHCLLRGVCLQAAMVHFVFTPCKEHVLSLPVVFFPRHVSLSPCLVSLSPLFRFPTQAHVSI